MIDASLKKGMSEKHQKCAKAIRKILKANSPVPQTGYKASTTVGKPKDSSNRDKITKRWVTLKQSKKDFKAVINAAGLLEKNPPSKKAWHLAVAPVAKPGTSKHGSGYAVDISGDNQTIKTISKALGATMTFDEKSHVHVEFKDDVSVPGFRRPAAAAPEPAAPSSAGSALSGQEMAELHQCRPDDFQDEVGSFAVLKNYILGRWDETTRGW